MHVMVLSSLFTKFFLSSNVTWHFLLGMDVYSSLDPPQKVSLLV